MRKPFQINAKNIRNSPSLAAILIIFLTLIYIWFFVATNNLIPCVQDCGETFIANQETSNYRLYGTKYGLIEDRSTLPYPDRSPYLYTHNINIGSLTYIALEFIGLKSLEVKQLITLIIFGVGLFYIYMTCRLVSKSNLVALVVLTLFCTDYAYVLTFSLNALRAWHWTALFGLIFYVLQYISTNKDPYYLNRFSITLFIAICMGVGYEFLAIAGIITLSVILFSSTSWKKSLKCIGWLAGSVLLTFSLRQIQIFTIMGYEYWSTDLLYSATIKVSLLNQFIKIPKEAEIQSFYDAYNILRPYSASVPLNQILPGLVHWLVEINFPMIGYGSILTLGFTLTIALALILYRSIANISQLFNKIYKPNKPFSISLRESLLKIKYFTGLSTTLIFIFSLTLGIALGLASFSSIAISIYLKHQFPLIIAPFLFSKGLIISCLIYFLIYVRKFLILTLASFIFFICLLFDHIAIQIQNIQSIPAMSTSWIPEIMSRKNSSFAVSWIPASVAGFTNNWVIGIQPGREEIILNNANNKIPLFTNSDLLEVNLFDKGIEEIEKFKMLRPDFWLYFKTDSKYELQGIASECRLSYIDRILHKFNFSEPPPELLNIVFFSTEKGLAFSGKANTTGKNIQKIEIYSNGHLLGVTSLGCNKEFFSGLIKQNISSIDNPAPIEIFAVTQKDIKKIIGSSTLVMGEKISALASPISRQPNIEEIRAANKNLSIAASGVDFILFDLRPFWRNQ